MHASVVDAIRARLAPGLALVVFAVGLSNPCFAQQQVGDYASHASADRSLIITGVSGERIRITPYGDYMVRVQAAPPGEEFYPDDRYEMVESHDWDGALDVAESDSALDVSTAADDGILVSVDKQPLRLSFSLKAQATIVLAEGGGVSWSGDTVTESFEPTTDEHFAGLGHEAYGKLDKLDRRGTSLTVTSGSEGACVVPFFVSSRGYGVFLNTTFTHTVNLGQNGAYSLSIDGEGFGGQMDYFFIAGPALTQVVDRYTQLTGRPRLPQRSLFGLLLSDKSDPDNEGEAWWKRMITEHRDAGFAFDHQVNDNAWRASNEATSGQMNSWFEFRDDRYPDPAAYKQWCDQNGVTVTLDLNRPGIPLNPSWSNAFSIPGTTDCPDFTNPQTVDWIWDLFFSNALDPSLGYPGDAIWLDEFDYPDHAHSTTLASGKSWAEESINYHFSLLKACVEQGWDPVIGESKRPYFWSRGITAGAQRFGSYWTGDVDGNWTAMADQVKAMQSAGISGFPYFNHDAGAHFTPTVNEDNLYRQWDMGFGSFTPIWKPHGPGHKRWPLQRNATCQETAKTYITTRYEMIPYIYSYAHIAQETGVPMARSMFLEDQDNPTAWERDLQYFWGKEMLVAPNFSDGNNEVSVWLPSGNWYYFWDDSKVAGDTTESVMAPTGVVPAFVKEGSIIPMAPFATSTFFIPNDVLVVHAYTGADGSFRLYEDDGVSERFRTRDELRTTELRFRQQDLVVEIGAALGSYDGAPSARSYQVVYHGLTEAPQMYVASMPVSSYPSEGDIAAGEDGSVWHADDQLLSVFVAARPVDSVLLVSSSPDAMQTPEVPDEGGAGGSDGDAPPDGAGGAGGVGQSPEGDDAMMDPASTSSGGTGNLDEAGDTADSTPTEETSTSAGETTGGETTVTDTGTPSTAGDGQPSCAAGLTLCEGACVDLAADVDHCGECGSACAAGQVCAAAQCTSAAADPPVSVATDDSSESDDGSGCGCATPGLPAAPSGALGALLGLTLFVSRRRQYARLSRGTRVS
jgi:alpha-D-xyloside xylohydrolase